MLTISTVDGVVVVEGILTEEELSVLKDLAEEVCGPTGCKEGVE